jgi:hypothetical protein
VVAVSKASSIDWGPIQTPARVRARIEKIAPLLEHTGEFRAADTNVNSRVLAQYGDLGLVNVVRVEHDRGSSWTVYEWNDRARRTVEQYRASLDSLPCGCHAHIPPGDQDTREGALACKYCGTAHDKSVYRRVVG